MKKIDVIIVGGGPAGLAAAVRLYELGVRDICILEREKTLGGILRQCIHDGFGVTRFKESLSGPEYAQRFIRKIKAYGICYRTDTMVTDISADKVVTAVSREGIHSFQAGAVVLAMGCRERTRGALGIPGERPAGIFTAGAAQSYINLYNRMPARETVILGSGDIGMIMARRLTLEGAHVQAVLEIKPYPSGLPRNIQQCLNDYEIPLLLSHTVTEIHGKGRLEGITVSRVDERMRAIPGTDRYYKCDTLILSVGLIPENELSQSAGVALDEKTRGAVVDENYQTNCEGIFAAGNVLHVHDLVDYVSMESERLAAAAADYLMDKNTREPCNLSVEAGEGIGYTVPKRISGKKDVLLSLRVRQPCRDCRIVVNQNGRQIGVKKMKKANPAEMIQLTLRAENIAGEGDLEVMVEC